MANVQISDVVVPASFTNYQVENSFVNTAFFQSGVAVKNGVIEAELSAGASQFTVPFWNDLAETEANYSTDNSSDVAQTLKIGSHAQNVRKVFANQGWASADLAAELSGSDPLARIQSRVSAWWDRQMQKRLIASLLGVMAANVANNASDMIYDVSGQTGALSKFGATNVINAAGTLGDRLDDVKAIAMSSAAYNTALQNDEVTVIPNSQGVPFKVYRGLAVIVDDGLTVTIGGVAKNLSVLFGAGAVGYGFTAPRQGIATEIYRNPALGNGGGITQLWSRANLAIAPLGFSWSDGTGANAILGESPTLADLQNAAHWTRVAVSRKACPIAFLLSL